MSRMSYRVRWMLRDAIDVPFVLMGRIAEIGLHGRDGKPKPGKHDLVRDIRNTPWGRWRLRGYDARASASVWVREKRIPLWRGLCAWSAANLCGVAVSVKRRVGL